MIRLNDANFVVSTELRRKTIPIFFDMMHSEFMSGPPGSSMQQRKRNFEKVARRLVFVI